MSKTVIEKMIIEEAKDLSVESLNEILDFILFIKTKKMKKAFEKNLKTELDGLNKMSLVHLEEEFLNYQELYPRE